MPTNLDYSCHTGIQWSFQAATILSPPLHLLEVEERFLLKVRGSTQYPSTIHRDSSDKYGPMSWDLSVIYFTCKDPLQPQKAAEAGALSFNSVLVTVESQWQYRNHEYETSSTACLIAIPIVIIYLGYEAYE
ncbi:hypothetical protein WAI453_001897 [Rhynchosporium graminicola]